LYQRRPVSALLDVEPHPGVQGIDHGRAGGGGFPGIHDPNAGEAFLDIQRTDVLPDRIRTCYIDRVHELTMPTLIIHGEKDTLVPLAAAREAVQRNPAIRLEVLLRCGHWPQRDAPEEFNRAAAAFFAR
jgi:pimeloyl-ACP methyl ester carboxylesterase